MYFIWNGFWSAEIDSKVEQLQIVLSREFDRSRLFVYILFDLALNTLVS